MYKHIACGLLGDHEAELVTSKQVAVFDCVLSHACRLFPGNFGHDMGDLLLPMYRLLRLFALHRARDVQVTFQNRNCTDYLGSYWNT